jgi:hypothetical protein
VSSAIQLCPPCPVTCPQQACNQSTGVCETLGEADGDGEADATDACPGTPSGTPVDAAGCSQAQFCAGFDIVTQKRACKRADWQNDEPLMKASQADCRVDKDAGQCVPSP